MIPVNKPLTAASLSPSTERRRFAGPERGLRVNGSCGATSSGRRPVTSCVVQRAEKSPAAQRAELAGQGGLPTAVKVVACWACPVFPPDRPDHHPTLGPSRDDLTASVQTSERRTNPALVVPSLHREGRTQPRSG